jgi:tetratricopeptide (TPR) repeat protein
MTDMIVTDLSQSPDVEVLGTDRLVQILTAMKRLDDRAIAFDTVQEIAKQAGVKTVILGSYVKAADTIRINLKLQDAATGRLVTAERIEAAGEANLFPAVDELTKRIKAQFILSASRGKPPADSASALTVADSDLRDVTTSSIEAYRHYLEGDNLLVRGREEPAIAMFEKAVAIDPNFALALVKLAVAHNNLGQSNLRREYATRALQHLDRLTLRERYYIQGIAYSDRPETLGKAIEAYRTAIELFPDATASRSNLASIYHQLERFDEAIRELEHLRGRAAAYFGIYARLSNSYASIGSFDKAQAVVEDFISRNPNSPIGYELLGGTLLIAGKLDAAERAAQRGVQARDPSSLIGLHHVAVLREHWSDVQDVEERMRGAAGSFAPFVAINIAYATALHGHLGDALKTLRDAAAPGANGSNETAMVRNLSARFLFATEKSSEGLAAAQRALEDAQGRSAEWDIFALIVEGHGRLGHTADCDRFLRVLAMKADTLPSPSEKRRVQSVTGLLALQRKQITAAIGAMTAAEQQLPVTLASTFTPHVPIWFAAGKAHLLANHDVEAAARFQRIVNAGYLRINWPIEFVRSFYLLGQISERQGDRAKAAEYYRRFVEYWGDGEIDREQVAEARKKIEGL